MAGLVKHIFCNPLCNVSEVGLLLKDDQGQHLRLFFALGGFVQDGMAQKSVFPSSHYKDPYSPTSIVESRRVFFVAQVVVLIFVDLQLREDSHLNHVFFQMSGSTTTYLEDHPRTCKWLVTPIYKPFGPFIRGITPFRGLTNHGPMVINHLLTGMVLQVDDTTLENKDGTGTSPFCSKENHVSSTSIFLARSCWVFLLGICRENMLMND